MKILVLGGSYFLGKAFVEMAANQHEITVLNRGTKPINTSMVKSIVADRHDLSVITSLNEEYDVIVDFCGYTKGDIELILDNLSNRPKQYIFISTADVYYKGSGNLLDEQSPLETRLFPGPEGEYIAGKAALEKELVNCCEKHNVKYTSIRPAFIYGEDNYAPRESMYFLWILKAGQIIIPTDATGTFQMIYVKDLAKLILSACLNKEAYNEAFNAGGEPVTYKDFENALKKAVTETGIPDVTTVGVTVQDVYNQGIPLPFPLTVMESEKYNTEKAKLFDTEYISLKDGLKNSFLYYASQNLQ